MSIFEYDEEKELELFRAAEREVAREEAREEALEEGRKEGLEAGQIVKLVDQVCRKLRKGKSAETITDELEEDLENILLICKVADDYAPDYNSQQIYEALQK